MSKFKVGDKVRAIAKSNGWGNVRKGDEGVVTGFTKHLVYDIPLVVADFPNQSGWFGQDFCFELIEEDRSNWHKHHDCIVAWAKGAEIEYKCHYAGCWKKATDPTWAVHKEYRIKPEKSEKDLRIEDIQKKMSELNDELEKLKGE